MARVRANINPNIIKHARESLREDSITFANRLGFEEDRLKSIETENGVVYADEVLGIAKKCFLNPHSFYSNELPEATLPVVDFRYVGDKGSSKKPQLVATVNHIKYIQEELIDLLDDREGLDFIGSWLQSRPNKADAAEFFKKFLGLQYFKKRKTYKIDYAEMHKKLMKFMRAKGIFVINFSVSQFGKLTDELSISDFRGFCLSDKKAPIVVFNGKEKSSGAISFTLIHELVHLFLGNSSISNDSDELDDEKYCNAVAAEFLIPTKEFNENALAVSSCTTADELEIEVKKLTKIYKASKLAIARKAMEQQLISKKLYWLFYEDSKNKVEQKESFKKTKSDGTKPGGGNAHRTKQGHLGKDLVNIFAEAASFGRIKKTEASRVLGISSYSKLKALHQTVNGEEQ